MLSVKSTVLLKWYLICNCSENVENMSRNFQLKSVASRCSPSLRSLIYASAHWKWMAEVATATFGLSTAKGPQPALDLLRPADHLESTLRNIHKAQPASMIHWDSSFPLKPGLKSSSRTFASSTSVDSLVEWAPQFLPVTLNSTRPRHLYVPTSLLYLGVSRLLLWY